MSDAVGDSTPAAPPSADRVFTEYRRRRLRLADQVRAAMGIAEARHDEPTVDRARQLLARLAEDRFQLALIGQFSRGKSTLMNAVLGDAYLPMGAVPTTSIITTVRYGRRPRAIIRRRGSLQPIDASLTELARYVAGDGDNRATLQVVSADIELPAEILRLGVTFVDTPGVGSAIAANSATTERFLPEADAVIFVTSFESPLTRAEVEFFSDARSRVEELFVVINKADLVSEREAEQVVRFTEEQLSRQVGIDGLHVFVLSARQALEARRQGERDQLLSSGLPELEAALVAFLTTDKSRVFLTQMARRAEQLVAAQRSDLLLSRRVHVSNVGRDDDLRTVEAQIDELRHEQRAIVAELTTQVRTRLPALVEQRSAAWSTDLRSMLSLRIDALVDHAARGHTALAVLNEGVSQLDREARKILAAWVNERACEVHALTADIARNDVETLRRMRALVEPTMAAAVGIPASDVTSIEPVVSLPMLVPARVPWVLRPRPPWWFGFVSASRSATGIVRRLQAALDDASAEYSRRLAAELVRAALRAVGTLGTSVDTETRAAVTRFCDKLSAPPSDDDLVALGDIARDIGALRAEVISLSVAEHPLPTDTVVGLDVSPRTTPVSCTICRRLEAVLVDYMREGQFQLAVHDQARIEYADAGGFCALHTWDYAKVASDLGIAASYARLAEAAAEKLRVAAQESSTEQELHDSVAKVVQTSRRCPACQLMAREQHHAVTEIIAALDDRTPNGGGPGLCVTHLAAILAAQPDLRHGRALVRAMAARLSDVSEDMRTYALGRTSLRRHLLTTDEMRAHRHALGYLAGLRTLARPWERDED